MNHAAALDPKLSGAQAAVEAAGGAANLGRLLGVSRWAAHQWLKTGIPLNRVPAIADVTGLPRHAIRPDFFDAPQPAEAAQ